MAERISLKGICRVLEIKAHQLYTEIPDDLVASIREPADIELICLNCETDENYAGRPVPSFVLFKANKKWLWLPLDRSTRQVVTLHVGDRGASGALGLWQALLENYRQKATFYTDDWDAYKQIIPTAQHRFSKQKKNTNHVERFFCTLRQRASRLVRLSLSFSKNIVRHVNAIRFFVTHYNLSLYS